MEGTPAPIVAGDAGRWRALALLSLAELLALSLWFSASAVLPAISREWEAIDARWVSQPDSSNI